jgi:hypothetical protein
MFSPVNIVIKGVFFLPIIRYLKPTLRDYVYSLYGICLITVRRRIRNRLPVKVLPQGGGVREDGDDEAASPTENNAMNRIDRGDGDNCVGRGSR